MPFGRGKSNQVLRQYRSPFAHELVYGLITCLLYTHLMKILAAGLSRPFNSWFRDREAFAFFLCAMVISAMAGLKSLAASADEMPASSAWSMAQSGGMRLLATHRNPDGNVERAGIEIQLARGYKTYWRSPGDSGVPPRFDFSGSLNIGKVDVLFPAPHVFEDASGRSIGYKEHVVFPLHITPREAGKPVKLNVKMEYGICDKLCIPAQGVAAIGLGGPGSPESQALISDAEALAPKLLKVGEIGTGGLSIQRVSAARQTTERPVFEVDVTPASGAELLVEGMDSDWYFETAKGQTIDGTSMRFFVSIFDPQSGRNHIPCDIRLTVIGKESPVEVSTKLEGCTR